MSEMALDQSRWPSRSFAGLATVCFFVLRAGIASSQQQTTYSRSMQQGQRRHHDLLAQLVQEEQQREHGKEFAPSLHSLALEADPVAAEHSRLAVANTPPIISPVVHDTAVAAKAAAAGTAPTRSGEGKEEKREKHGHQSARGRSLKGKRSQQQAGGDTTPAPAAATAPPAATAVAADTPPPAAPDTPAPTPAAPNPTPAPTQAPVSPDPTPFPTSTIEPSPAPASATPEPEDERDSAEQAQPAKDGGGGENKVATPRFTDGTHSIKTYTDHIECDTKGATVRYTLDGSDPLTTTTSIHEVSPGGSVFVNEIGTITIRAVATKEGMEDSDEARKTVTIQDQVQDPVLFFAGEKPAADEPGGDPKERVFLRTVAITMNCSTPNATIRYTTDGLSVPGDTSPSVSPGTRVQWSDEGTTEFRVVAVADGLYQSELTKWPVSVIAPRLDEYPVAGSSASSSPPSSAASSTPGDTSSGNGDAGGMLARVEVTAFEAVYPSPAAELEQQEVLGPGFGAECDPGARVVRGKLVRLANPIGHFSFTAPPGACDYRGGGGGAGGRGALSLASETSRTFQVARKVAPLLDGESPEEAKVRLDLDAREAAWRAAGGGNGCQAAAAGGLLPPLQGDDGDGVCAVGHLVGAGQVFNAEKGTGLVSFGVRGGSYVVGVLTAKEVLDEESPFQDLISGAGWLVRAGVNNIQASARDGHLDALVENGSGGKSTEGAGDDDEAAEDGEGRMGAVDDLLTAKLARTAIGHDSEGRLILLQTSGAAAGSDQDTAIPDGLNLSELADILVEAGAVNAINLVGGAPSALLINGSAVMDPAEPCRPGESRRAGGFTNGSTLPRCERPVSSVVCVHLDPPPLIEGSDGGLAPAATPAPAAAGSHPDRSYASSSAASAGAHSSDDDWWDSVDDVENENKAEMRLQWTHDLCGGNSTGNSTTLWDYLDGVEESALRYKIAFWVAAALGMVSLYFNIQHQKGKSFLASRSAELAGGIGAYGRRQHQQLVQRNGLMNGGIAETGTSPAGAVEMVTKGGKRGSRRNRQLGSSIVGGVGGSGYSRVNGGADWDEDGGAAMESEEEVDLGLPPPRSTSSRKRDKGNGSRLKRALSKVSKRGGGGDGASGHGAGDDIDAAMALNPFVGGDGGGRSGRRRNGSARCAGDMYNEGNWA